MGKRADIEILKEAPSKDSLSEKISHPEHINPINIDPAIESALLAILIAFTPYRHIYHSKWTIFYILVVKFSYILMYIRVFV